MDFVVYQLNAVVFFGESRDKFASVFVNTPVQIAGHTRVQDRIVGIGKQVDEALFHRWSGDDEHVEGEHGWSSNARMNVLFWEIASLCSQ